MTTQSLTVRTESPLGKGRMYFTVHGAEIHYTEFVKL
jgi:hypothetical protein